MLPAALVAENYFLESRHMLLEIAAHIDRYEAAVARDATPAGESTPAGGAKHAGEHKMARLREALAMLAETRADRERTVALLELFGRD